MTFAWLRKLWWLCLIVAILLAWKVPVHYWKSYLAPEVMPQVLLVFIGICGVWAALRTLKDVGRQSDYLEKQTHIQQTAARQWVRVGNWRQHRVDSKDVMVAFDFEVTNPTTAPLFVDLLMFKANGHMETTGLSSYLVPNTPFPWQFVVGLNQEEATKFLNTGAVLNVEVSVFFRDAFDNKWEQTTESIFQCRHHNNFLDIVEGRTKIRSSEVTSVPAPPMKEKSGTA
jgi:hypothetical protein